MLKFVTGFSKDLLTAKERAAFFYNQLEVRTRLEFIETQQGLNELQETAWITTIWYTELADPVNNPPVEAFQFIGSTGVDPNDPDWRQKLAVLHQQAIVDALVETQEWEDTTERRLIHADDLESDTIQVAVIPTVAMKVHKAAE